MRSEGGLLWHQSKYSSQDGTWLYETVGKFQQPIAPTKWLIPEWKWKCYLLSHVQLFATAWMVAHQGPLSMGFPRQEYWSRLSFPSPGNLPNPGIKPRSPALQADSLTSEPTGKHLECPNGGKLKDMYLPCFQEGFAIVQSLGQDLA